jgi:hypothetical protein
MLGGHGDRHPAKSGSLLQEIAVNRGSVTGETELSTLLGVGSVVPVHHPKETVYLQNVACPFFSYSAIQPFIPLARLK